MAQLTAAAHRFLKIKEGDKKKRGEPVLVGYLCPAKKPTAGWGHTGPDVEVGKLYTREQCEVWYAQDTAKHSAIVQRSALSVPTNDNEFSAMVLLCYNIGPGWDPKKPKPKDAKEGFRQSSVLRHHLAGRKAQAAAAFSMWNKATNEAGQLVELRGLTQRRAEEAAIYLTPMPGEEDVDPLRTRAADVETGEPPAVPTVPTWIKATAAGVPATTIVAKEAIVQVNGVWSWLQDNGIDPHIASAVMAGTVAIFGLWTVYAILKHRRAVA